MSSGLVDFITTLFYWIGYLAIPVTVFVIVFLIVRHNKKNKL